MEVRAAPARSAPPEAFAPRAAREAPEWRALPTFARDPAESLACRADPDCTITCRSDGSCCLEQCGCSQPMGRLFLERLELHLARECGPDPLCPIAGCVGTKLYEARCERGKCVAVKMPGGV